MTALTTRGRVQRLARYQLARHPLVGDAYTAGRRALEGRISAGHAVSLDVIARGAIHARSTILLDLYVDYLWRLAPTWRTP